MCPACLVFASNDEHVIQAERDDRRNLVLTVDAKEHNQDHKYFDRMHREAAEVLAASAEPCDAAIVRAFSHRLEMLGLPLLPKATDNRSLFATFVLLARSPFKPSIPEALVAANWPIANLYGLTPAKAIKMIGRTK
jgi:hypothetical protein